MPDSHKPTTLDDILNTNPSVLSNDYPPFQFPFKLDVIKLKLTQILETNHQDSTIDIDKISEAILYIHDEDPQNQVIINFTSPETSQRTIAALTIYYQQNAESIQKFDKGLGRIRDFKARWTEARLALAAAPNRVEPNPDQTNLS